MENKVNKEMKLSEYVFELAFNDNELAYLNNFKIKFEYSELKIISRNLEVLQLEILEKAIIKAVEKFIKNNEIQHSIELSFIDFNISGFLERIIYSLFSLLSNYQSIHNLVILYTRENDLIRIPDNLSQTGIKSLHFRSYNYLVSFSDVAISNLFSFGAYVNVENFAVLLKSKNMKDLHVFLKSFDDIEKVENSTLESLLISTPQHYSKTIELTKCLYNLKNFSYSNEEVYDV